MRPRNCGAGSPWLTSVHVCPPSVDFDSPLSLYPGSTRGSLHFRRIRCHNAAYSVLGSDGSITRSIAPVRGLWYSTFVQVLPPLVVLNTPRVSLSVHACPADAT